jgi:hypothetical protein
MNAEAADKKEDNNGRWPVEEAVEDADQKLRYTGTPSAMQPPRNQVDMPQHHDEGTDKADTIQPVDAAL